MCVFYERRVSRLDGDYTVQKKKTPFCREKTHLGQISKSIEGLEVVLGALGGCNTAKQQAVQALNGLVARLELVQVVVD